MGLRLVCRLTLVLALGAPLLCQSSGKKPITVDAMVSAPVEHSITPIWTSDGTAFAYADDHVVRLYDVVGRRSKVWFETSALEGAAQKSPEADKFDWQNRRVVSDPYQWFPNNKDLLAAVDGNLFIVHPDGKYDRIKAAPTNTEDPKLSPDGKQVLYRNRSNLYVLNLATKKIRQLTFDGSTTLLNGQLDWVYPEELYLGTAAWWSPDSKRIAYMQFDVSHEFLYPQVDLLDRRAVSEPERYPQAGTPNALVKIGIVSPEGGETKWMDTGATSNTLLARLKWLPDSSQVAIERFTRIQDKLDLLFCDASTGKARTVIHEQSKTWINVADNLYFLKSRPEFFWTSERSGYRHIYRYSIGGKLLRQLTSGDWEVNSISAVDEARKRLYYTSSETSPLETQFYEISFNGGERSRITASGSTHAISASPRGDYYVDTFSNVDTPPETVLQTSSGQQVAVIRHADFAPYKDFNLRPVELLHFKGPDGTTFYARLIKPAGFNPGTKYPAIVYVYGGPGIQSVRNKWYGIGWEQVLANCGYIIWQMDNRGSNGRGHAFEIPVYRNLGRQEVADQRTGVEYLLKMGFADPNRIGITGWSYGGYMTIRSLLLAPDLFKVGVAGAPVNDWHNYDTIYTERYMGLPDRNPRGYEASSNVQNADQLRGRLLIVHNLEDDNVLFQNTMQMIDALEKADKRYSLQVYPQKTHGVTGRFRKPMYSVMTDFFAQHLKNPE